MTKTDITKTDQATLSTLRKTSLVAGLFYLLTFVSIPTLALYSQVKVANYIVGSGPDTPVIIGGILEIIVALAGIGTAVVLYPVLRKAERKCWVGSCRRPYSGIWHHFRRSVVSFINRDFAAGRSWSGCVGLQPHTCRSL